MRGLNRAMDSSQYDTQINMHTDSLYKPEKQGSKKGPFPKNKFIKAKGLDKITINYGQF